MNYQGCLLFAQKNHLAVIFLLVGRPGLEPGTISLKGSRSTS